MSDTPNIPKLIEARAFWHSGSYFERHRAIDQSELEYGYTKYVRKDTADELAEALDEIAGAACGFSNLDMDDVSEFARAALAKYKETET